MKTKNKNKIGQYLALTLGAGASATSTEATTITTFYGQGVPTPTGISVGSSEALWCADSSFSSATCFGMDGNTQQIWSDGTANIQNTNVGYYSNGGTYGNIYASNFNFRYGAVAGDLNYALLSFNGADFVYEAVGQFHFDGTGGGYLIAIARNDDDSSLSIIDGKAAIDSASVSAVPEASTHLALLALGSAGLLTRRRMKRAA